MNVSTANQITPPNVNQTSSVVSQQPSNRVERERVQNSNSVDTTKASTQEQRLDAEPQALALVEQEYLSQQENENASVLVEGDTQQASNSSTSYDNPSEQNQTAVSTYQSVDNLAKQESIQQLFGVDLYA